MLYIHTHIENVSILLEHFTFYQCESGLYVTDQHTCSSNYAKIQKPSNIKNVLCISTLSTFLKTL